MLDINERAVKLSKKNIKLNRLKNVEAIESDGFSQIKEGDCFDVIITNPPIRAGKQVIYDIYKESYNHLKESRNFISSY